MALDRLATGLWDKAWGKPWPYQSIGKVSRVDISTDGDLLHWQDDNVDIPNPTTRELEYLCLHNIQSVVEACDGYPSGFEDILVIRPEYVALREMMMNQGGSLEHVNHMVITGHSGIGKTAFLLYLLLYRLEHQLPTAIHLYGNSYFLFEQSGATRWPANGRGGMTRAFWALADSNHNFMQPCHAFLTSHARVIQTSPPRLDRWKSWIKQLYGEVVITDLPHPLEIVAIAKELKLDTSLAYQLVHKWGPCTREIISNLRVRPRLCPSPEDSLERAARWGADNICAKPPTVWDPIGSGMADDVGSAVLFVRPLRSRDARGGDVDPSLAVADIPTPHLLSIFKRSLQWIESKAALRLFRALSSPHAFTLPAADWRLEIRMHAYLCSGSLPLPLFRAPDMESSMQPSQSQPLWGSINALGQRGTSPSFYWFPPEGDLPGIDGVLGDGTNVYALQVSRGCTYRSPAGGLRTVWENFDRKVRYEYAWHIVFVSDGQELAQIYADRSAVEMANFTLGKFEVGVEVWGCVLPSRD